MKKWIIFILVFGTFKTLSAQSTCGIGTISGSQTICTGSTPNMLQLTYIDNDTSGLSFQWQDSTISTNFTDASDGQFTHYQPESLSETTYYRVKVSSDTCDIAFSGIIIISVDQLSVAGTISLQSDSTTICEGDDASFLLAEQIGDIQWQASTNEPPGPFSIIDGAISTTYTALDIQQSTYYRATVKNGECVIASTQPILITVDDPPEAPDNIILVNDVDSIICNGSTVELTANGGNPGTSSIYQWGTGTVGTGIIPDSISSSYTSDSLTSDTQFWVKREGNSACTNITDSKVIQIQVLPVPSVTIGDIGELCQLSGQSVLIQNTTPEYLLQPLINVNWQTNPPLPATAIQGISEGGSYNLFLDLDSVTAPDEITFQISQVFFQNYGCLIDTGLPSETFSVKPRASVEIESIVDDLTNNQFCQDYGPVAVNISSTPADNVVWDATYANTETESDVSSNASFNIDNSIAGNHIVTIDSIAYSEGLACKFNPADFGNQYLYEDSVTIKETPEGVDLSFLSEANYEYLFCTSPTPRVNNLNSIIPNIPDGYELDWKLYQSNDSLSLANNPLQQISYFPVFVNDGCESQLVDSSDFVSITLINTPNLAPPTTLVFPGEICNGTDFQVYFEGSTDISHLLIRSDPLNSDSLINSAKIDSSIVNSDGENILIINQGFNDAHWEGSVIAQNKAFTTYQNLTCSAAPIDIDILVHPNANFEPPSPNFDICQNGDVLTIDPFWNLKGNVNWDDPLNLPAPYDIDSSKVITLYLSQGNPEAGNYGIRISGSYPESNCTVDTTFHVNILANPELTPHILDIDGTICHNEYTHIEIVNPNPGVNYQWACTECESNKTEGTFFLPHWENPNPGEGETWQDLTGTYSVTAIDTTTNERCENFYTDSVNILGGYTSCPEGIDFFKPNGLSLVDAPALYFQWYDVESDTIFTKISGATDQTYFNSAIDSCDPSRYIVASSLYIDRCWSTTVNCFENFGLRECDGPKSKAVSNEFILYPNPAIGREVKLENLDPDLEGRYTIDLIDLTGKTVLSKIIRIESTGMKRVALPTLVTGIYVFRISNGRYTQTIKLLIN